MTTTSWYKRRGYPAEYRLMKWFQKNGWLCYRTAGSKGQRAVDLIAIRKDSITNKVRIKFIQVKATETDKKALSLLSKKEKEELRILCDMFKDEELIDVELWVHRVYKRKREVVNLKKFLNESV